MRIRTTRVAGARSLLLCLVLLLAPALPAHEISPSVTVDAWVVLDDDVDLLLRVPIDALQDLSLPVDDRGALRTDEAMPALRDAAELWLGDQLALLAGADPLPARTLVHVRTLAPGAGAPQAWLASPGAPSSGDPDPILRPDQLLLEVGYRWADAASVTQASGLSLRLDLARLALRTYVELRVVEQRARTASEASEATAERVLRLPASDRAIPLVPGALTAASAFLREGLGHIAVGLDHLLLLTLLALPLLGRPAPLRPLAAIATAFAAGHAVTVVAAAIGWLPSVLWFGAAVELTIAATVLGGAVDALLGSVRRSPRMLPLGVVFAFGVVHGAGFARALLDVLPLAGEQLVAALVAFNLGIEIGQLLWILALVLLAHRLLPTRAIDATRALVALLVAHTALHWCQERAEVLLAFGVPAIGLDLLSLRSILRGAAVLLLGLAFWRLLGPALRTLATSTVPARPGASADETREADARDARKTTVERAAP